MFITLSGIGMVILEKSTSSKNTGQLNARIISLKGVTFGVGRMLGQVFGCIEQNQHAD
jgi:hypothetical protein